MNDPARGLSFDLTPPQAVSVWQRRALVVGVAGAIGSIVGWVMQSDQFYRSYLVAYLWCIGLTLGSLAVLMIYHLTGGAWGTVIRRTLEAAVRTLPLMIVLFIPILLGMNSLYSWSRPEVLADDEHVRQLAARYLALRYFILRAVVYFAGWAALAWLLVRISDRQDHPPEVSFDHHLRVISAPGMIFYGLSVTLAAVDWVMSLDPHWFSTLYGLIFVVGQGISTFSFVVILAALLVRRNPMSGIIQSEQFLDLGKLMLATVMLWGYFAFSQWLIIWSGNLPEEITFYLKRTRGGWENVALFLVVFQFAVPFMLLLSRSLKSNGQQLLWVALGLILVRLVDLHWFIMPSFSRQLHVSWLDVVVPLGMGGLWLAYFFYHLGRRPLLAFYDAHVKVLLDASHEYN